MARNPGRAEADPGGHRGLARDVRLTVLADLTIAVEVGTVLAALMFIRRVADTTTVELVTDEYVEDSRVHSLQDKDIPDYVAICRIHGPFLFGSTDKLDRVRREIPRLPRIVVLRLRNMTAIDATGLKAIEDLADHLHATGRTLLLCGARSQPLRVMRRAEFHQHLGEGNILPHVQQALVRARELDAQYRRAGSGESMRELAAQPR